MSDRQNQDRIRVLRLVEYEGPRGLVEKQVRLSLHGTRAGLRDSGNEVRITATTLGIYPEVIEEARAIRVPERPGPDVYCQKCSCCGEPLDAGVCKNRNCDLYVQD
jgi:hypothetical protein